MENIWNHGIYKIKQSFVFIHHKKYFKKKNDLENCLFPLIVSKVISRQNADLEEFEDKEILEIKLDFTNK